MQFEHVVLVAWAVLVFFVLGQIWFVQIVVYPLFARVGVAEYVDYHRFYGRRIPLVVIVPGFLTFLLPVPLALWGPGVPTWMSATNIGAGLCGLVVTILFAIPRHARLERGGKDETTISELIRVNWVRTASITAQGVATFTMLCRAAG